MSSRTPDEELTSAINGAKERNMVGATESKLVPNSKASRGADLLLLPS